MKLEQQQKWIDKHKRQYELVCNEFVQKFCDKQEIDFDGWVGNEIGGIALFACQYSFNLSDIILDLTTKQPKGLILEWQNADVDFNMFNENQQFINYKSYTMGLRHEQSESKGRIWINDEAGHLKPPKYEKFLDDDEWAKICHKLTTYLGICGCQRKLKSIVDVLVRIYEKGKADKQNWTSEEYLILAMLESKDLITHGINCEHPIMLHTRKSGDDFWEWICSIKDNSNLIDN